MTNKRILARLAAGVVLAAGASLLAAAPAQAGDTGWNGTKVAKEKPAKFTTSGDTGWNGT